MAITFRDGLGIARVIVNQYGIQFLNGTAYFADDDETEYRIPVGDIIEVMA